MARLVLDPEQRFSCSQCGRCCRRPWEIVVTAAEVETYRARHAELWYREREQGPHGTVRDPFEPIPRVSGFHRIRKRDDGACGFLTSDNLCRIHQELGERRKPLTCRMFPYRLHPTALGSVVTTSFCCPTTATNQGTPLKEQLSALRALQAEWSAVHTEKPLPVRLARRRALPQPALGTLRDLLREMLDRPGAEGRPDLRANVGLMARTLEDLSRYRVLGLADERLVEYLELTGRFAARSDKPLEPRPPTRLARLLFRGFLFVVAATRLQLENRTVSGLRLSLRLRLVRLLAHVHGAGPPVAGIDLSAMRANPVRLGDELHPIAYNYLRSALRTIGSGRRPVVDEIGVAVGFLNVACALAAMRASQEGGEVEPGLFTDALMEAVDLTHAADRGFLGRVLSALAGGVEALYLFEAGAGAPAA